MRRGAGAALALAALVLTAAPARAGTEQFSTFDVERSEEDDESLLDHLLTAPPRSWDESWRRAERVVQTEQGCLTSGQWLQRTRLRLSTPLGGRSRFGVEAETWETDLASWSYFDFTARFPQRRGTLGFRFRPFYDKSRQDLGVWWETGSDTAAFHLLAAFTFEDAFNNLWAWRQTRVGDASRPYDRHPFEPALRIGGQGAGWRAAAAGLWLTPSAQRGPGPPGSRASLRTTLWGTRGEARLEAALGGVTWEAAGLYWQARSTERAFLDPAGGPYDPADSALAAPEARPSERRLWQTSLGARRGSGPWHAEARWIYRDRDQRFPAPGRFRALDRTAALEVGRSISPTVAARVGALFDRIGVHREGLTPAREHGRREEKRIYLGLEARFGNVRVFGVEGFELDPEPYEVWLIHDKGFLGLQAVF